jgi:ABC-type multidrug transport system fused ATPase/permease subunit
MGNRLYRTPLDNQPASDPGEPDLSSTRAFLWWLFTHQSRVILVGTFFGTIGLLCAALTPGLLGRGIQAIADQDHSKIQFWISMLLLLGVVQATASLLRHQRAVASYLTCISRLQALVSRKAVDLGADLPRLISTGEISAVNSNDIEKLAGAFDIIPRLVGAVVSFVVVSYILISTTTTVGLMVVIAVPLLGLGIAPIIKPLQKRESVLREKLSHASDIAADIVSGLRILRGIGGEESFLMRFRAASQEVRVAAVRAARVRGLLDGLQILLPGFLILGVIWAGGNLVIDEKMKVGELLAFYGYSAYLGMPLQIMTESSQRITSGIVATRRVLSLLCRKPLQTWGTKSFFPEGEMLRDGKSGLEVLSGEYLGIVCDDSLTADDLCDRLGGYLEAKSVFYGESPLSSFTRDSVRAQIYSQEKEPSILSGTVASHFSVQSSGRVSIEQVLRAASAEDILDSLEGEGMAAEVVEKGRTLSGGQRQRMALARTLFVDAPILVLDDPTSAVDSHTESRIATRLKELRLGKTTVIVTSSPLILDLTDRVALLISGRVVSVGIHQELLISNQAYRELVVRG